MYFVNKVDMYPATNTAMVTTLVMTTELGGSRGLGQYLSVFTSPLGYKTDTLYPTLQYSRVSQNLQESDTGKLHQRVDWIKSEHRNRRKNKIP